MGFFTFVLCFLALLILITVIGSIEQFALWAITKKNNEFVVLIIPALCSLIIFTFIMALTYLILNLFNINCLNIVYSMFMNWDYNFNNLIVMLMGIIGCFLVFIPLQALCIKLVEINYSKIFDFIKYKIFRKKEIKTLSASEDETSDKISINLTHNLIVTQKPKTSFFYYLASSILTFAILFFSILLFIYIGVILGQKYLL